MALTLVQHNKNSTSVNQTFVTLSGLSSIGVGNLIVVLIGGALAAAPSVSITDNIGTNVYTRVAGSTTNHTAANQDFVEAWFCQHSAGAVTAITANYTTATVNTKTIWVFEVNGFTNAGVDIVGIIDNGTGVASVETGASVLTTTTLGFIAACTLTSNSVTSNPAGGNEFTSGGDISSNGNAACSLISSTAATHTPQWGMNAGAPAFTSNTVAFKEGGVDIITVSNQYNVVVA